MSHESTNDKWCNHIKLNYNRRMPIFYRTKCMWSIDDYLDHHDHVAFDRMMKVTCKTQLPWCKIFRFIYVGITYLIIDITISFMPSHWLDVKAQSFVRLNLTVGDKSLSSVCYILHSNLNVSIEMVFLGIGISSIKIKLSWGSLIFIMVIPMRRHLHIETARSCAFFSLLSLNCSGYQPSSRWLISLDLALYNHWHICCTPTYMHSLKK